MLKVDTEKFIKSYKQYTKDINLLKILLKDKRYRQKWCKKRGFDEVQTDEELINDIKRYKFQKEIMEIYLVRCRYETHCQCKFWQR